ncbi:MAG: preprotein translocase subunit YajC [Clostridia bacterium]|nr:preprotein translocase subunit YajC [Clostridia bacterium]
MQEFFQGQLGQSIVQLLPLIAIFGLMYLVMIKPQQKRKKQEEELRKSITIGDEVVTIGGIMGRVVSMKDDTDSLVIETGSDKVKIKKWAVASCNKSENK